MIFPHFLWVRIIRPLHLGQKQVDFGTVFEKRFENRILSFGLSLLGEKRAFYSTFLPSKF